MAIKIRRRNADQRQEAYYYQVHGPLRTRAQNGFANAHLYLLCVINAIRQIYLVCSLLALALENQRVGAREVG